MDTKMEDSYQDSTDIHVNSTYQYNWQMIKITRPLLIGLFGKSSSLCNSCRRSRVHQIWAVRMVIPRDKSLRNVWLSDEKPDKDYALTSDF